MSCATVERWLQKASNDLRTAQTMLSVEPPTTDTISFHAQQCVEKVLKAYLSWRNIQVEPTHYLPRLVELCAAVAPAFQELRETAVALTDYAVNARYPDDWTEIQVEEAKEAVAKAHDAAVFVARALRAEKYPGKSFFDEKPY